jgi:hypothetical protein
LKYPQNHIEVDNRLSWFLGTLEKEYGGRAFYVQLLRRPEEVAKSLAARGEQSILFSFTSGILQYFSAARNQPAEERQRIGLQYWDVVNDNIELFLRDKPHRMTMWLHDIKQPFKDFWRSIGADGDLEAALGEWDVRHNATEPGRWSSQVRLAAEELSALIPEGETFILVDEDQWGGINVWPDRRVIPLLDRVGRYLGTPPDGDVAINEIDRLRLSGASFIAFGWPAFWWLDYFSDLHNYLNSHFSCLLENERIIVYDLRIRSDERAYAHRNSLDARNPGARGGQREC